MNKGKRILTVKRCADGVLPENFGVSLKNADETELRVLAALLVASNDSGEVLESVDIASSLGIDEEAVESSVNFWRGTGLVSYGAKKQVSENTVSVEASPKPKISHAHKNGAVVKSDRVVEYQTGELADILEHRKEISVFVDEAQRVIGKTLNMNEIGILVGLIEQYGFDTDAILAILAHTTRIGKKGIRYVEKTAIGLYDEGLTGGAEVFDRIQRSEAATETISKIKELFGIGSRSLSTTEKNLFRKWIEVYGYDIDIIRRAYDITIDAIHEPRPKYTNGVIEKWHVENLRTLEEIYAFEAASKAKREAPKAENKSYDINEFFDAALKRSFDEFN